MGGGAYFTRRCLLQKSGWLLFGLVGMVGRAEGQALIWNNTDVAVTCTLLDSSDGSALSSSMAIGPNADISVSLPVWRDALLQVSDGAHAFDTGTFPVYLASGCDVFINVGATRPSGLTAFAVEVQEPSTAEVNFWIGFGVAAVVFTTVFYIKAARAGAQL